MKNIEELDTNKLINSLVKYVTFVVIFLLILITLSLFFARETEQEVVEIYSFLNPKQVLIYLGVFLVLLLAIKLIKRRVKEYQKVVTQLYIQQLQSIQKSEKYHKALFDTMPNILIIMNAEVIEDANSQMLSFFAYSNLKDFRAEHSKICDFFIKDSACLSCKMDGVHWLEYIKKNPDLIHKVMMYNQKKEKCYFRVYRQELEYDNKQRVLISFVDVTAFEKLNERLKKAINGTTDGLWDWDLLTNEMYLSPRWKSMLGYKDEELTNKFENWSIRVHPSDLQSAMQNLKKSQEKQDISYNGVYRLKHKDGHWVWILSRAQTLFDENGEAIRMVGFHTDISELKRLELELLNSQKQFELFMNNVPYIVVIKDEVNKLIYENKVSKARQNNPETIKLLKENFKGKLYKKIEKLANDARENGVAEDVLEYKTDSQQTIYRALAFSIPEENSKIYVGIIYINITEHKLLAQEVQLQNQIMIAQSRHAAMGEMISMIAHQWRQPLGAISMDVNNVLIDIELGTLNIDSLKLDMNGIIEQTNHLSQTIDDFINFFKPDKVKDLVSVEDVFENAFHVISKSLVNNNIIVENHFEKVPRVKIFERELQQVIINLLKNAKEALQTRTKEEKKIISRIFETQEDICIEVCDNGGGILQENIKKVFDPYFSTKDEKNGTGLGLYMSKIIVEKHLSARLSVRNEKEGACFTIAIPKKDNEL